MFAKNPEKYRGTVVKILSVLIMVLIAVQFYVTLLPCVPVDKYEKRTNPETKEEERILVDSKNFTIAEVIFSETDTVTNWIKSSPDVEWTFSINPYADMIAYATGLGITVIIMTLISLKCFATHIVSMVWAIWAPLAWYSSKIWELATMPVVDTIRTVTTVTLLIGSILVVIRTVIYLTYRFIIPFFKWKKQHDEWEERYFDALDAEEAATAAAGEVAAN